MTEHSFHSQVLKSEEDSLKGRNPTLTRDEGFTRQPALLCGEMSRPEAKAAKDKGLGGWGVGFRGSVRICVKPKSEILHGI